MQLTSTNVLLINITNDPAAVLKGTPISSLTKGFSYLVGVFQHSDGRTAVMLNNRNPALTMWTTASWSDSVLKVVEVDQTNGTEVPVVDASPQIPGINII